MVNLPIRLICLKLLVCPNGQIAWTVHLQFKVINVILILVGMPTSFIHVTSSWSQGLEIYFSSNSTYSLFWSILIYCLFWPITYFDLLVILDLMVNLDLLLNLVLLVNSVLIKTIISLWIKHHKSTSYKVVIIFFLFNKTWSSVIIYQIVDTYFV